MGEVNRVTSLILLGLGHDIETVFEMLTIGVSTIYQVVKKYLMRGFQAMMRRTDQEGR